MDELNMAKAKEMYDVLCRMMDNKGWHYEKKKRTSLLNQVLRAMISLSNL